MSDQSTFELACRIPVRYSETDQMRYVYHAHHLVYFEVARTAWLASRGQPYHLMEEEGTAIPIVEAHCQYLAPARYGDTLAVEVAAELVDGLRMRFRFRTWRGEPGDTLLAEGWTVHVCMDPSGKPRRMAPQLRKLLVPAG